MMDRDFFNHEEQIALTHKQQVAISNERIRYLESLIELEKRYARWDAYAEKCRLDPNHEASSEEFDLMESRPSTFNSSYRK